MDAALTEVAAMNPRLVVCLLALSAAPGCAVRTWRTDTRPIPRAVADASHEKVRLTLRNGSRLTLIWPYLDRDSVREFRSWSEPTVVPVPLSEIRAVARLRTNWPLSIVATTAVTAGAFVGVAFVVCATTRCLDFHFTGAGLVSRRSGP
jgi:hypothetical protein